MKTILEMNQELEVLHGEVESLVTEYNEAVLNNDFAAMNKADVAMKEKINEHSSLSTDICFENCKNSSDDAKERMLYAIKMLNFPVLAVKDEKKGDEKISTRVIFKKEKAIDILKLDKYCGGIGFELDWNEKLKKFNLMLIAWQASEIGIDPCKAVTSTNMANLANELKFASTRAANAKSSKEEKRSLVSNSALLRALKDVTYAMVEEKNGVISIDVNYIKAIFAKKGRNALTLQLANDRSVRSFVAEVGHRVVLEKEYEVEVKSKDL